MKIFCCNCGGEFEAKDIRRRYCSKDCLKYARREWAFALKIHKNKK